MDKKDWFRSFVELVIIFVGVYGAFLLNNYRQQNQTEEAQLKYYQTFLEDLQWFEQRTEGLTGQVQNTIEKVEAAEPDALPYNRKLAFPNSLFIVSSAYEGKNFESLTISYLISIEVGTNLIKRIERRFQILDEAVRTHILFEETGGQEFKSWYLNELNFIQKLLFELQTIMEEGAIPATKRMIAERQ